MTSLSNVNSVIIVRLRKEISPNIFAFIRETDLSNVSSVIIVLLGKALSPFIFARIQAINPTNVSSVIILPKQHKHSTVTRNPNTLTSSSVASWTIAPLRQETDTSSTITY
eukprot:TRINITY_DN603_c1_g1_i9.p2 TRINITY_DN603_c1_g1~~TRINITY_DN603_c1_g1_i9.p2  ORF type:complete len:111 (-),score=21.86 TRINITY_DN603_c1_g1_i9:51-383(-)